MQPSPHKVLITIHSQKGGVGKSLLAYYLADRLSKQANLPTPGIPVRRTVLIDADLTGTSLADVLPLQVLPMRADNRAGTRDHLSVEETRKLLKEFRGRQPNKDAPAERRSPPNEADALAFLNHCLLCDPLNYQGLCQGRIQRLELPNLLWSHEGNSSLAVIPSSAHPDDIKEVLPFVYREEVTDYFHSRLDDLLWMLLHGWDIEQLKKKPTLLTEAPFDQPFDAVVIDTPPGLHGLSLAALDLHRTLWERWRQQFGSDDHLPTTRAVFVHTDDLQDLVATARRLEQLPKQMDQMRDSKGFWKDNFDSIAIPAVNRFRTQDENGAGRVEEDAEMGRWDVSLVDNVPGYIIRYLEVHIKSSEEGRKEPEEIRKLYGNVPVIEYSPDLALFFAKLQRDVPPETDGLRTLLNRCLSRREELHPDGEVLRGGVEGGC